MSEVSFHKELEKRVKNLQEELGQCRHAEQELRKSRYYSDRITSGMFEPLVVLDRNFIIQDVNDRFLQKYGPAREKVIGKTCHEVTHGFDTPFSGTGHPCPLKEILTTGKPVRLEHLHTDKNGQELIIEIYAFPLFGDDGEVENIVEIHHDVTNRRRAEREQARRERLEGVLEMAGAVCHELNQPLAALMLYCHQLLETESEDERLDNHIRYVLEKVASIGAITKKLQNITKYETRDYVRGKRIVDIDKASQIV